MDAITATLALKALDGLSARQTAIAENIANAGTAGYRPVRVSFETALMAAANQDLEAISGVQPQLTRDPAGEAVRVDLELASGATTTARYSALVEVLNRQLQIAALAVQGGR